MAFTKATIALKPASIGTGIKCALRKGKVSAATLTFFLSMPVAAKLNIGDGDKIEVLIGDGEHHGLIRLRKNNSAGEAIATKRDTGKASFISVRLGHQPVFVDRTEPGLWCQWEMEDGWTEIVLPKWASETNPNRAKMSAVPPAKPAAAAPQPERRGPGRPPTRAVTADIMGDPKPGRREMLAKMGEMKA